MIADSFVLKTVRLQSAVLFKKAYIFCTNFTCLENNLYLCTDINDCKKILLSMKKIISTPQAPAAIGPYSQAVQVGNLVYTSGQIPIDPATGVFAEGGIKEQTRQSLLNVKAILEEAGLTMSNVVKTTVFLADMGDFADMNEVYAEFFAEPYPARSAVAVKALPKGALVEIEVVAGV